MCPDSDSPQSSDAADAAQDSPPAGVERRQAPRFAIEDCTIQHKRAGLFSFLRSYSAGRQPLVNISLGGLQFLTNDTLKVDDVLHINAHIPGVDDPLRLKGTVVWVGRGDEEYISRVGVLFNKASEEVWRRLKVLERSYSAREVG